MNAHATPFPIACDLTTIPAARRAEHARDAREIFSAAEQLQELPDGYALRLQNKAGMFMQLARFVAQETLCCPFFGFALEIEPEQGALWLRLTGRAGVKEFLQAEFLAPLGFAATQPDPA